MWFFFLLNHCYIQFRTQSFHFLNNFNKISFSFEIITFIDQCNYIEFSLSKFLVHSSNIYLVIIEKKLLSWRPFWKYIKKIIFKNFLFNLYFTLRQPRYTDWNWYDTHSIRHTLKLVKLDFVKLFYYYSHFCAAS